MKEIICVDGSFPPDFVEFYKEHGVATPQENSLYSIRAIVRHMVGVNAGQIGLLLNELVNPPVPIVVKPLGQTKREPTWNSNRFRHLDGSPLLEEELKELEREHNLTKNLNF